MGARAKFLELVVANGWTLDTEVTKSKGRYDHARIQDPHAFVKAAAHGGTWHINLNYVNNANVWSNNYDDRLRWVTVDYADASGERVQAYYRRGNVGTVRKPSRYDSYNGLWEVLAPGSLRERAEKLVKDPDLAVWLGQEARYAEKAKMQVQADNRAQLRRDQAQPLQHVALGDGEHGYGSKWREEVADKFADAAKALRDANGTTDIVAEIVKARLALDAIEDALTEEGQSLSLDNYLETKALETV